MSCLNIIVELIMAEEGAGRKSRRTRRRIVNSYRSYNKRGYPNIEI
jgi:hypothetical protein